MNTLIHALQIAGYAVLAIEALLVVGMIYLAIDYILDNVEWKNENKAKHRAPSTSPLERAKQMLREQKEKEAQQNRFWGEYWVQGFYNADQQARRDDQVMAVLTSKEL